MLHTNLYNLKIHLNGLPFWKNRSKKAENVKQTPFRKISKSDSRQTDRRTDGQTDRQTRVNTGEP